MNINDRELLARTLQAEAGNQGYDGMLAAGSVIMNRANTTGYGDGMRGVILKPGQFSAWNSLTGYAGGEQGQDMAKMRASDGAYKAADAIIGGGYNDATGGATHYYNPSISRPNWGQEAGGDWKRIGDHVFGFGDARNRTTPNQSISNDAMTALGQQPISAASTPTGGILSNEGNQMAQQPQGLLGSMGIQRRDPNAQGETSQPFYNRQSFGDTMARIAPALGRMGVMGLEGPAQAALDDRNKRQGDERAKQAQAARTNQTREWIASQPNGEQFAAMFDAVGGAATLKAMQDANAPSEQFRQATGADLGMTGKDAGRIFNVGPDGKITSIGGAAPTTNITTNVGPDETAFNKETGKIIAQEADSVAQQGAAAQRSMGQLTALEQALLNSKATS